MRTLMMLAAIVSLTACNRDGRDRDRDRDRDRSERSDRDRDRAADNRSSDRDSTSRSGDSTLEAEIAREVEAAQAGLPRDAGGGVTLERMEASGTEINFTLRTRMALDESRMDGARNAERASMCRQTQTQDWFRRGARFNYHIIDSEGETFDFSFNTCPT